MLRSLTGSDGHGWGLRPQTPKSRIVLPSWKGSIRDFGSVRLGGKPPNPRSSRAASLRHGLPNLDCLGFGAKPQCAQKPKIADVDPHKLRRRRAAILGVWGLRPQPLPTVHANN